MSKKEQELIDLMHIRVCEMLIKHGREDFKSQPVQNVDKLYGINRMLDLLELEIARLNILIESL